MDKHSRALRQWAAATINDTHKTAQDEAADHIDSLREDIESLHQKLDKAHLGESSHLEREQAVVRNLNAIHLITPID